MSREIKKETLDDCLSFLIKQVDTCYTDLTALPDKPPSITSGSLAVDLRSGIGGFPVGGCVEIAGPWSSGKTTLAICCAAAVQERGGTVLLVDFEQAFDPYYAQSLGLDITPAPKGKFILLQPTTLEDGWNNSQKLLRTGGVQLCIIDSIAAGQPKEVIEGEVGSGRIASQSLLLAPEYNKMAGICRKTGATALWLNQIRTQMEKKGRMTIVSKDTSGGNALKHYCLQRLWMHIQSKIETSESTSQNRTYLGNLVKFQFIKNKCAAPYKMGTLVTKFKGGIDNNMALLEMGLDMGVIDQRGAYFIFNVNGKEIKIQGKDPTSDRIANDKVLKEDLIKQIKELD